MKRFSRVLISLSLPVSLFAQPSADPKPDTKTMSEVLLSFDAVMNAGKVELTWASSAERNNNQFTIEKSKDALNFKEFLNIRNFGNNSHLISYFDVDFAPYNGITYYRLTQTNAQGKAVSSRVVSVNNYSSTEVLMMSDGDVASAEVDPKGAHEELVVLRNEKGEESVSHVLVNGSNDLQLLNENAVALADGTYLIIASSDSKLYSRTVKIQH